ncbi:MAG: response regulator [Proteobacteria bacterium]|nr:response regulator [Pseudomonadota bacterium]
MKNVLIVDDCRTTRKLVSYLLKEGKFNILQAENGFDALEKLARNDIDIVLTDLNMPQMDGIELIRSMKEDDSYKDIPIVMLTTEADEAERSRGLKVGASCYLTKPVGKDLLLTEIKKYIN